MNILTAIIINAVGLIGLFAAAFVGIYVIDRFLLRTSQSRS